MSSKVIRAQLAFTCAVLAATAAVGHVAGMPGYWCLALLLVGVLLAPIDISAGRPGRYILWRSGWVAASGVWLACAVTWTPWTPWTAGTWVAATITVVMLTPVMARPTEGMSAIERALTGPRVAWRDRIKRVARIDVPLPDSVTRWENGFGYTVEGEFYEGGHTWEDLAGKVRNFGSDLRLSGGCTVEVSEGGHQAAYQIRVTVRDAFNGSPVPLGHADYDPADDYLAMPEPIPGSIEDPAPVGPLANGDIATVRKLRSESVLIAGATGSGKTAGMISLARWHVTRIDQVLFMVDLTGGRLGASFIEPYLEGKSDRPAIEGLADTPERVAALLTWLRDVANSRPVVYRDAIRAANDDKIPVSPQIPAIRILIDEPKTIWGDPRLAKLASEIIRLQETTRAAAIRFDYTALAGTLGSLPADLKKQISLRFATRAADLAEVAYVLDWGNVKGLSMRALSEREGMAYMRTGAGTPQLLRFWRSRPTDVWDTCIEAARIRPSLDEAATSLPSFAPLVDRWEWQRQPAMFTKEPAMVASQQHPQDEYDNAMAEVRAVEAEKAAMIEKLEAQAEAQDADRLLQSAAPDSWRTAVTEFLNGRGPTATKDIIGHLQANGHGQARQTLQSKISAMADDGVITRAGHGLYEYP